MPTGIVIGTLWNMQQIRSGYSKYLGETMSGGSKMLVANTTEFLAIGSDFKSFQSGNTDIAGPVQRFQIDLHSSVSSVHFRDLSLGLSKTLASDPGGKAESA
jgi:hypothetical protein